MADNVSGPPSTTTVTTGAESNGFDAEQKKGEKSTVGILVCGNSRDESRSVITDFVADMSSIVEKKKMRVIRFEILSALLSFDDIHRRVQVDRRSRFSLDTRSKSNNRNKDEKPLTRINA